MSDAQMIWKTYALLNLQNTLNFRRKNLLAKRTRLGVSQQNLNDRSSHINTDLSGAIYKLKNNQGFIKKRKKSKVIRYYHIDSSRSDYFRVLIMLYMPWRDEESEVLDVDAEVVFQDNSYHILQGKKEFCKLDDETLDGYLETLENDGREA
jgi:hypothetical protein